MTPLEREALRQQMLLRALLGDARPGVVAGWLRDGPNVERGLGAYRANAGALAERALAAAYPTVQQLLGEESFAALARAFWQRHPPTAGDLALWGAELPGFLAQAASLAEEPYLADVARVDWALHQAERAADAAAPAGPPPGLDLLATQDPAELWLRFVPGTALVVSPYPVATIWHAHRNPAEDRFEPARAALALGQGENALVLREGWRGQVHALGAAEAAFTSALLEGRSLGPALAAGGEDFGFEPWLLRALQRNWLLGASTSKTKV